MFQAGMRLRGARLLTMSKTIDVNGTQLVVPSVSSGCVFLKKPFPECYCMNLTSSNIPRILMYCDRGFQSCQIYCRRTGNIA